MKKITLVTIGVTGALILTTAATAMAAPSVEKEQAKNDTQTILNSSTAKSAPTELPEKFQDLEFPEGITLPEKEQETEADSRKPFAGSEGSDSDNKKPFVEGSRFKSAFVPKLKPETKPEVEDRVPPEYEGVENIDQLGRPEFSEEGMPEGMREEIVSHRGESEGQRREFGEMPGEFDDQRGESGDEKQFGNETPDNMRGERKESGEKSGFRGESEGQRREFGEMPGEFDDQRGESADQPNFRGESAPDEQSGSEVAL